jgi:putative tricarboxylic transport membrane protein
MKKLSAGLWGGIAVLITGLVFFFYSRSYPYVSEYGPGPGMFPIWLSGLLILLSGCYIFVSLKGKDSSDKMPGRKGMLNVFFLILSMAMFVLLLPVLGFNICASATLFALLFRAYRWFINLAISIGSSVSLYVIFSIALDVNLPVNALGF